MEDLTVSSLENFVCKRCGIWFGLNVSMETMQLRIKSKYKDVCTKCLKPHEMSELQEIMKIDDEG